MKAIIKTYWVITEDELGHKHSYVYEGTFTQVYLCARKLLNGGAHAGERIIEIKIA